MGIIPILEAIQLFVEASSAAVSIQKHRNSRSCLLLLLAPHADEDGVKKKEGKGL